MRRWLWPALLGLLVLVLLTDLGYRAWSERPYVVTGYSESIPGTPPGLVTLTVRYRLPRGAEGR